MQIGGEGGADIRIVFCFVSVFLSFSLLAFALALPGFSGKDTKKAQQRREMPERPEKLTFNLYISNLLDQWLEKY